MRTLKNSRYLVQIITEISHYMIENVLSLVLFRRSDNVILYLQVYTRILFNRFNNNYFTEFYFEETANAHTVIIRGYFDVTYYVTRIIHV